MNKVFSFRLPGKLVADIDHIATLEGESRNELVRSALDDYLSQHLANAIRCPSCNAFIRDARKMRVIAVTLECHQCGKRFEWTA
jgi:metal-responsive CopG/Arc/MetJ family transcriptional regulator